MGAVCIDFLLLNSLIAALTCPAQGVGAPRRGRVGARGALGARAVAAVCGLVRRRPARPPLARPS